MDLTLYLAFSSLDRGALINFLRMWDGALKWRFLFFLREEEVILLNFILVALQYKPLGHSLTEHLHVVLKLIPDYVFNCILLHWVSVFLQFKDARSVSLHPYNQSQIFQYVTNTKKKLTLYEELQAFVTKNEF